jgi:hypothetical protein
LPTSTTEPNGEEWSFENVWTYWDEDYFEFYVWGEVVNNTASDQRIVEFLPIVYDEDRIPINSEFYFLAEDYELIITTVSVSPGGRLPFSFVIYLPFTVAYIEDNYEIQIQAEPAAATRSDLTILDVSDDGKANLPDEFYVWVTFENSSSDLQEYAALIITLYDDEGRVIGVGGQLETDTSYLEVGEHEFEVIVDMRDLAYYDLDVQMNNSYLTQLLAY